MSSMVLLLPKALVRPNKELGGGDISRAFILFTGRKSWKARCHLIFLMTINRKWCCSKSSTSPFHTVEHQFGQRMFLRHCTLCASHGWGADLEFGQFSALASLYKFKQIMATLSQPSHDTEVRLGAHELRRRRTSFLIAFSLWCHGLFSQNSAKAPIPSQPRSFPCIPPRNFSTFPFWAL